MYLIGCFFVPWFTKQFSHYIPVVDNDSLYGFLSQYHLSLTKMVIIWTDVGHTITHHCYQVINGQFISILFDTAACFSNNFFCRFMKFLLSHQVICNYIYVIAKTFRWTPGNCYRLYCDLQMFIIDVVFVAG